MITKRNSPFTLIEIIITLGVIMVGLLPLLGLLTATTISHVDNQKLTMCNMLAAREMNELKLYGFYKPQNAAEWKTKLESTNRKYLPDLEFPGLSSLVETISMESDNSVALCRIGIGIKTKQFLAAENKSFSITRNNNTNTLNLGQPLKDETLKRYSRGGYICANLFSVSTSDAILSFDGIRILSNQNAELTGLKHYSIDSGTSTKNISNCNVYFLDQVYTFAIARKYK